MKNRTYSLCSIERLKGPDFLASLLSRGMHIFYDHFIGDKLYSTIVIVNDVQG